MDPFTLGALALGALLLGGNRRNASASSSSSRATDPSAPPQSVPARRRTRRGGRGRGAATQAAQASTVSAEQLENKRKNHAHELAAFLASGAATPDLIKRYQIFLGVPATGAADAATLATLERYGAAQVSGLDEECDDDESEAS